MAGLYVYLCRQSLNEIIIYETTTRNHYNGNILIIPRAKGNKNGLQKCSTSPEGQKKPLYPCLRYDSSRYQVSL